MNADNRIVPDASFGNEKVQRPFVLALAERTESSRVTASELYFSESVSGLAMENSREKTETTGGGGNSSEGADTSLGF